MLVKKFSCPWTAAGPDMHVCCSELRLKDIERVQKHFEGVKALEKRGLSKDQKEELVICQKVLDWLQSGKDVRQALHCKLAQS